MGNLFLYGNTTFPLFQHRYVVVMAFRTAMSVNCELRPAIGRLISS